MKCGSSVCASRENYGFAEILVILLDPIKVAQDDYADRRKAGDVMLPGAYCRSQHKKSLRSCKK